MELNQNEFYRLAHMIKLGMRKGEVRVKNINIDSSMSILTDNSSKVISLQIEKEDVIVDTMEGHYTTLLIGGDEIVDTITLYGEGNKYHYRVLPLLVTIEQYDIFTERLLKQSIHGRKENN